MRTHCRALAWVFALVAPAGCIEVPSLQLVGHTDDVGTLGDARSEDGTTSGSDARGREPDVAVVGPADATTPRADAALGPELDAARPTPDATPPPADGVVRPPDAGRLPLDAATPAPDAALARDGAIVPVDAEPAPDAAPRLDAATPAIDAAPGPDAASPPPDADRQPDAAPPAPDAAPPAPDAAPPAPDAAPPPPDAVLPPPPPRIVVVVGEVVGGGFGTTVAVVADVTGDGFVDVVVGAPASANAAGHIYLLDGRTGDLVRSAAGAEPGDRFGASLLVGHLVPGAEMSLGVGAPAAQNGRGRLSVLSLPDLRDAASSIAGDQGTSALGTTLVPQVCGGATVCIAAPQGGAFNAPRVSFYQAIDAGGLPRLERTDRFLDPTLPLLGPFGAAAIGAPRSNRGAYEDLIVSGRSVGTAEVRRYDTAGDLNHIARYTNAGSDTFGTALAVLPGGANDSARLLVGDPGDHGGRVAWFERDATNEVHELSVDRPATPGALAYGTSVAVLPNFPALGATTGVCVGAPGDVNHDGVVECRDTAVDALPLVLGSPSPGDAFGQALAASTVVDPDGTVLLVVGAPRAGAGGPGTSGSVSLVHLTPAR